MANKVEQEFEAWKKKTNYKPVNEGFLDDDDDKSTIDSLTIGDTVEDKPDDDAAAELTGTENGTQEEPEVQSAPSESDSSKQAEQIADVLGSFKDVIADLKTTMQTMNDTLAKQAEKNDNNASDDNDEFAELDLSGAEGEPDAGNDAGEGSADGEGNNESNDSNDGSNEETDSNSEPEDNTTDEPDSNDGNTEKDGEKDNSDEEYSGGDEHDDTKSEAYNQNMKHGGILNSNSHTLVGILESQKYWKLDDGIDTIIQLKLRERIEKAKSEFRQKMLESILDDDE